MKAITGLFRSTLGAFALATLLVAPLGCAGVDEEGELVSETAQAVGVSQLSISTSRIAFGTILSGASVTLPITLTNTGLADAEFINLTVPPDPYRVVHNPPTYLDAGLSSSLTQITFAPTSRGAYERDLTFTYRDAAPPGSPVPPPLRTLIVRVTGTAN